ncbi:MAG: GGDEF domain-containing protein, partial [Anaerolineales bacterium]|nr:GGDEF domain-containing protein [Anaerolineales bacterium]
MLTPDKNSTTSIIEQETDHIPQASVSSWLIGRPLSTADAPHQTIGKAIGLAVFASDALSSSAYAIDEILIEVARTLSGQMRKGELVARLGGDEFAVLCPGIEAEDLGLIASRLVQAVAALRFETPTQTLRVGCSVG